LSSTARSHQKQTIFDITDVLNGICEKLIRRHPHIYGDVKADDAETVKKNWEQIKQAESKGEKICLIWSAQFHAQFGQSTSYTRKSSAGGI
jgi:uncharacterized protein YabN with tetrapyrrole methylase and pyrophosphatase domain